MKDILYTVISVLIISAVFFFAVLVHTNIPDVHVSHSTGECVEVINYDERFDYNCKNYPSQYNHVWVK